MKLRGLVKIWSYLEDSQITIIRYYIIKYCCLKLSIIEDHRISSDLLKGYLSFWMTPKRLDFHKIIKGEYINFSNQKIYYLFEMMDI